MIPPTRKGYLVDVTPDEMTGHFVAQFTGDLRGRFITGILVRSTNADGSLLYDTSEFSNAVQVH